MLKYGIFINVKDASVNMILMECHNVDLLKTIMFVKAILNIIFIVVPIGLIIMMAIDFLKVVIAGNENEQKENFTISVKRAIAVVVLFFVPTIVNLLMSLLGNLNIDWNFCYNYATRENIEIVAIENVEKLLTETKKDLTFTNLNELKRQINNISDAETRKKYENELKKLNEEYNSKVNTKEESSSNKKNTKNNYTIYIGDSRTVGMCMSVSITNKEKCIAKGSMGFNWFSSTAIPELKQVLKSNPKSNIVINMGTNDLNNASKYAEAYNNLAKEYPKSKIVAVSVTKIDDSLATSYGYTVRNSNVVAFNTKLKSLLSSKVKYCDVYSKTKNTTSTTDGVHYNSDSYNKIYQAIKNCL